MSRPFPYTYISCPCNEASTPEHPVSGDPSNDDEYEEERTFDPRSPLANYSLFPPEQLLYCEDCHTIKCPRCTTEEIICYYCPNCLFETPSSMVRSEGNRCARNCFNCPICTSPLMVNSFETTDEGATAQSYILSCGYCQWTSLDIGIKFDKPSNIRSQLGKMVTDRSSSTSTREPTEDPIRRPSPLSPLSDSRPKPEPSNASLTPASQFAALKSFYKSQLATINSSSESLLLSSGATDYSAFSSPSALNRILSLYTSSSMTGGKSKTKSKPPIMREALSASEGLHLPSSPMSDTHITTHLATTPYSSLPSLRQRFSNDSSLSPPNTLPTTKDLLPLPTHLATKRSKRCIGCRHILVKPESKPQSTRFRIRLVALSYIPLVILKPLTLPTTTQPSKLNLSALSPHTAQNFTLTLQNHIFNPIRVTLATPARTPGRFGHRITLLCPSFEVGANSDVWDEALNPSGLQTTKIRDKESSTSSETSSSAVEAGKIWAKGRNWTSVVLEVVPASLKQPRASGPLASSQTGSVPATDGTSQSTEEEQERDKELDDDEDVLEIPIFVRLEYDVERDEREREKEKKGVVESEKRELAYWMVLGVGRVVG